MQHLQRFGAIAGSINIKILFHARADKREHVLIIIYHQNRLAGVGLWFYEWFCRCSAICNCFVFDLMAIGGYRQGDGENTALGMIVGHADGAMMQLHIVVGDMQTDTATCL